MVAHYEHAVRAPQVLTGDNSGAHFFLVFFSFLFLKNKLYLPR